MADDEGNPGMGLLIEAIDWTDASVVLDMADGEIIGLSKGTQAGQALEGFELGWTQIDVLRQTVRNLWHDRSLFSWNTWRSAWRLLLAKDGLFRSNLPMWRDYLRPDFHPEQHDASNSQAWLRDNTRFFTPVKTVATSPTAAA